MMDDNELAQAMKIRQDLIDALALIDSFAQKLQTGLFDVENLISPKNVNPHQLPVPWIGQNTALLTDDYSNSDCGPACVSMWLAFNGQPHTVDEISVATGLTRGYIYTLPGNLILAASHFCLSLERITGITLDTIKAEINKSNPFILLVHYGSLPTRFDARFQAGHWIIVTGYDDTNLYYNDPYWPDNRGAALKMSNDQALAAMKDCAIDGNTAYQGLRRKA